MGIGLQLGVPLALGCVQIHLLIMHLETHDPHLHQAIYTTQASSNTRVSLSSLSNFLLASSSVILSVRHSPGSIRGREIGNPSWRAQ